MGGRIDVEGEVEVEAEVEVEGEGEGELDVEVDSSVALPRPSLSLIHPVTVRDCERRGRWVEVRRGSGMGNEKWGDVAQDIAIYIHTK